MGHGSGGGGTSRPARWALWIPVVAALITLCAALVDIAPRILDRFLSSPTTVADMVDSAPVFPTNTVQPTLTPVITFPTATTPKPTPTFTEASLLPSDTPPPIPVTGGNPSGKIVFTCQIFQDNHRDQICSMNPDGSGVRRLTTDDFSLHWYASVAPDGNSVIFSASIDGTNTFEIYEMDLSGNITRLTQGLGKLYAPEISPDGQKIVFTNERSNSMEIWVMNRDGSNPHPIYIPSTGTAVDPVWSRDGSQILFASGPSDGRQLFIIDSDGANPRQVTNMGGIRGRSDWGPDGYSLATYIGSDWNREIYLLNADGSNMRQITNGGTNLAPSFSPDGQWITFTSYRDNPQEPDGCEIYIMHLESGEVRRLTNNNYCDWQPRWGP